MQFIQAVVRVCESDEEVLNITKIVSAINGIVYNNVIERKKWFISKEFMVMI